MHRACFGTLKSVDSTINCAALGLQLLHQACKGEKSTCYSKQRQINFISHGSLSRSESTCPPNNSHSECYSTKQIRKAGSIPPGRDSSCSQFHKLRVCKDVQPPMAAKQNKISVMSHCCSLQPSKSTCSLNDFSSKESSGGDWTHCLE